MNSITQIMNTGSPKLFYLVRKVFGLFFVLMKNDANSQLKPVSNASVNNKDNSKVYILSTGKLPSGKTAEKMVRLIFRQKKSLIKLTHSFFQYKIRAPPDQVIKT